MNLGFLKARQTKYSAYVAAYVVVILAVLAVANWLANRYNKSYDATTNKRFSLSDQTKKVVKNLKQDVKVTYFDQTNRFDQAKDLLDRYSALSPKLGVSFVDPYRKPQIARSMGVKTEGTIFVEAGPRREEAKSLTEEEVTSAIIRAVKGGERMACAVSGSGEHGLEDRGNRGYGNLKDLLEKNNYKTQTISLLEKAEVPSTCSVVIVGGPRYDYTEPAVNALKKYVEDGGHLLVMLDPPLQMGRDNISDNAKLVQLLDSWGVTPDKDLVLDTSGIGGIFGLGPEVPLVTTYESHAIVREMKDTAAALPIARSVDTKSADKTSVEKLFSTTKNSYATTSLGASPIRLNPDKDKKGPFTLAAAGTYNNGKPNGQGRFVVVGSSDWVTNSILPFQGNRDLFLNMMAWLSADEDLISIRPKPPEDRRIDLTGKRSTMMYLTVLAIPLLVVGAGVRVWWRRR